MNDLPYNKTSKESIEKYALNLLKIDNLIMY